MLNIVSKIYNMNRHGEYEEFVDVVQYGMETVTDMTEYLELLQKAAGFVGRYVVLADESEQEWRKD